MYIHIYMQSVYIYAVDIVTCREQTLLVVRTNQKTLSRNVITHVDIEKCSRSDILAVYYNTIYREINIRHLSVRLAVYFNGRS